MKKLISLLCVLTIIVGVCAVSFVSASAAEAAKTVVDVKNGDEVTYKLTLSGVEQPIIGCDYSIYYDSSLLSVESVADFNDKTDEEDWEGLINTGLDGEVRGNWSILSGIDFSSKRNFITVNLKAKAEGSAHISYFVRYMYDNNIFNSDDKPQITDYLFECSVNVNSTEVLEDAQPELNVEETQTNGLFVNSITGDSKDADADIPGTVVKKTDANVNAAGNNNANADNNGGSGNNSGGNVSGGNVSGGSGDNQSGGSGATSAPPATTADGYFITATDSDGNVTATSDEAPAVLAIASNDDNNGGSSPVLWIIIALVVLAGGGAAAFFFIKKQPAPENTSGIAGSAPELGNEDKTMLADSDEDKTVVLDPKDQ